MIDNLSPRERCFGLAAFVALGTLILTAPGAFAASSSPGSIASSPDASPVLAAVNWRSIPTRVADFVITNLQGRERMVQMFAIGLAIGLFVMMRR